MPGIAQSTAGFSIQSLMRLPSAYRLDRGGSKVNYELLIEKGCYETHWVADVSTFNDGLTVQDFASGRVRDAILHQLVEPSHEISVQAHIRSKNG